MIKVYPPPGPHFSSSKLVHIIGEEHMHLVVNLIAMDEFFFYSN